MLYTILQNEASGVRREIPFQLVDSDTVLPLESITAINIRIRKPGEGSYSAGAGSVSELGSGVYIYEATVGEVDTIPYLLMQFASSGSLVYNAEVEIQEDTQTTIGNLIVSESGVNQAEHDNTQSLIVSSSGVTPTVAEISDGVWDEVRGDHTTIGTFGDIAGSGQLDAAEANIVNEVDTNEIKIDLIDTSVDLIVSKLPDDSIASSGQVDNFETNIVSEVDANEIKIDANLTAIQSISNSTRIVFDVPQKEIVPDGSGSKDYRWELLFYDNDNNMEDADFAPTISVQQLDGTVLESGSFTKPVATTGEYYYDHTVASGDTLEVLRSIATVTESGSPLISIRVLELVATNDTQLDVIENKIDTIDINVDAILVDTSNIDNKMPDETIAGSGQMLTVETNLTTEINANETKIDTLITNQIVESGVNQSEHDTTQSLIASSSGSAVTLEAIVSGVWDEERGLHTTVGTFGDIAGSGQLNAVETNAIVEIDANEIKIDTIIANQTSESGINQSEHNATQALVSGLNDLAPIDVENAVWDASRSSHTASGTFGESVSVDASGLLDGASLEIAQAVWDRILTDHLASGTTGLALYELSQGSGTGASGIAGAVWNITHADHMASGTTGFALEQANDLTERDILNSYTAKGN